MQNNNCSAGISPGVSEYQVEQGNFGTKKKNKNAKKVLPFTVKAFYAVCEVRNIFTKLLHSPVQKKKDITQASAYPKPTLGFNLMRTILYFY